MSEYSIPPARHDDLVAMYVNCTLTPSPGASHTQTLLDRSKDGDLPVGFDDDFTNRNTTFTTWNLLHVARMPKDNGGIPARGNVPATWADGARWGFPDPAGG